MINPKIVVIGGGTGSFTLLSDLKYTTPNLAAIVNMCDDGGSSGELRDELGVLPPGDIRQCLVALSNHQEARDLFGYRFGEGKLDGHPVGNIILSALELQTGSFTKAVKIVAEFLQITGKVIPVSTSNYTLVMKDGKKVIEGEFAISRHKINSARVRVFLKPKVSLNGEAANAIKQADMVVIAPGSLYGSLLPTLVVNGMDKALGSTKAMVVMIANLVNKPAQTLNWHVVDYVSEVEKYIGEGSIDYVIYNTKLPSKELLLKYADDQEFPLDISPDKFKRASFMPVGKPLIASQTFKQDPNDKAIKRTLIRHNSKALSKELLKLL